MHFTGAKSLLYILLLTSERLDDKLHCLHKLCMEVVKAQTRKYDSNPTKQLHIWILIMIQDIGVISY